jgi:magnesium and cobalt exporter, CNNM family
MVLSLAVFRPFLSVLNGTATLLLRLVGIRTQGHRHLHSPEEIALLIAESRDGGLLEPEEQKRLHRALQLGLRRARDLMVPIDQLTALRVDAPWDEVVQTVTSSPFSRLPIYRGTRDRIIGILRVRDLVNQYVLQGPGSLEKLMRPVVHAQADLPADRVIAELRARRAHQAVVIDQDGGTIGLITIQDLLAELLGPKAAAAGASQA